MQFQGAKRLDLHLIIGENVSVNVSTAQQFVVEHEYKL